MILGFLLRFFVGYDVLACAADEGGHGALHGAVIGALADAQITPWRVHHAVDGTLFFSVLRRDTERLRRLPVSASLALVERHGLPELALRYRRRIGIPLGALLFCVLLFYFSRILWRVEVTGAVTVPAEQIEAELATLGWRAGTWLSGEDLYAVSDQLLALDHRLSYASVVRRGTVLHVHVREREIPPPPVEKVPANLIAKKDGFVVSYTVSEGQVVVQAGQAVRAGELLISGVVLHRGGSLSVVCAEGAVYAKTICTATAEVPLSHTVREEVGRMVYDRGLKIFGLHINFLKSTGNIDTECGTITESRQMALPSGIPLPIWKTECYAPVYAERLHTYTPAEAVRLATARAQAQVRAEMGDAEVLTTSTVVEETADGYRVIYTVECMMDIATPRQIGGVSEEG